MTFNDWFAFLFETKALTIMLPLGPQPLEQVMDGGDANHGFTGLGRMLVDLAQTPVPPLPRIVSLHDPTHRQRLELGLTFRPAHDLQTVWSPMMRQPVVQLVIMIPDIPKDHLQAREVPPTHLSEDGLGRPRIVHISCRHHDGDQKTQGIHENMALAALDLLAAVDTSFLATQRGLDRLAVDRRRTGSRRAPGLNAGQDTQDIEEFLPAAVGIPLLEVVVDRFPGREVVRQGAPGTPFPCMIEQGINDLSPIHLRRSTS